MLKVKRLDPRATVPTVAHPGEDLAYDIYALEDTILEPGKVTKVRTGIAVEAIMRSEFYTSYKGWDVNWKPVGMLIRDRSSVASQGVTVSGGVIDAGYRGEIIVLLTNHRHWDKEPAIIKAGAKIAQMIPTPVLTGEVVEVDCLLEASRGDRGFGSSGQ